MRSTWDPTKRNKNIGTSKQGYGQNNELTIPYCVHFKKVYWERIKEYCFVKRTINSKEYKFIIEKTKKNYIHSCTVDDIANILTYVSIGDLDGINLIVLRQPKSKEEILSSCWGRLAYYAEINENEGPAIFLESVNINKSMKWDKSLSQDRQLELERLYLDGHKVTIGKKYINIELTKESVRNTQLYRTLLHELGHWVDYKQSVKEKSDKTNNGDSYLYYWELYDKKSSLEKETFAHKYAEKVYEKLLGIGVIPFDRIIDPFSFKKDKLLLTDFCL